MENKLNDLKPLFSHIKRALHFQRSQRKCPSALERKLFLGTSLLRNKTEMLAMPALKINVAPLTPHNPYLTYRAVHHQL